MDESCLRVSAILWLWTGVCRLVGQVIGFGIGDRTDPLLTLVWPDVPLDYRDKPVHTDYLGAYARCFSGKQHHPCDKGSGLTSRVEGLHTRWRQRQSGLVGRCCGVHREREDDLIERSYLLVEEHNQQAARRWSRQQSQAGTATQLNP